MTNHTKKFYSRQETADALGISLSTLIRHVAEGKIPHIKLGARVLIPSSFLDKLAETANTREGA